MEPGYKKSNIAPILSEVRCIVLLLSDLRPQLVGYVRGALRNIRTLEPGPYSFGYRNQAEFCFLKALRVLRSNGGCVRGRTVSGLMVIGCFYLYELSLFIELDVSPLVGLV